MSDDPKPLTWNAAIQHLFDAAGDIVPAPIRDLESLKEEFEDCSDKYLERECARLEMLINQAQKAFGLIRTEQFCRKIRRVIELDRAGYELIRERAEEIDATDTYTVEEHIEAIKRHCGDDHA